MYHDTLVLRLPRRNHKAIENINTIAIYNKNRYRETNCRTELTDKVKRFIFSREVEGAGRHLAKPSWRSTR